MVTALVSQGGGWVCILGERRVEHLSTKKGKKREGDETKAYRQKATAKKPPAPAKNKGEWTENQGFKVLTGEGQIQKSGDMRDGVNSLVMFLSRPWPRSSTQNKTSHGETDG